MKRIALTIGTFDGVHLGHRYLFEAMRQIVGADGKVAVVTFTNHPSSLFTTEHPVSLITPLEKRLELLKQAGVDTIIPLDFTWELANMTPEAFLLFLKEKLPFTDLVLGEGAVFGHNREGTEEHVRNLQDKLQFRAHYIPKKCHDGKPISSMRIRKLLESGQTDAAAKFLD